MPLCFTRTLRLKVRSEAYAWLNAAALEVNQVFNYCNETSLKAASLKRKGVCLRFAGKCVRVFERERLEGVTCSACGALSGPRGVNGLIVRSWLGSDCGESHDRDQNAARNILIGSRCRTSVRGNESSPSPVPPRSASRAREAGTETARAAA